jgi:hypothetical protein
MKTKKVRICDLTEWPPEPGEAFSGRGEILRAGTNETIVTRLYGVTGSRVEFGCTFGGRLHDYDYYADTGETANKLADLIKGNLGKSLAEIGLLEIEVAVG